MTDKHHESEERHWRDLYRIGGIASIAVAVLVLCAIAAYFIWPYSAMDKTAGEILRNLQKDPLGSLFSLDMLMIITLIIYLFPILALYAALKKVNESYALIALAFGIIAVATVITSRPLSEMVMLSEKFGEAATETEKNAYAYAAETLLLFFDGTAWFLQTIFFIVSGFINSVLMLKSDAFDNKIAWLGITASIFGLGFWIPKIGLVFLFVNTIVTIPWCLLVGRAFIKLGWSK